MAKGSVRKKGKKWYYRYYVEDASGNRIQKECVGTESKAETERLLRKAIEEYEETNLIAKSENITLGELLDIWTEEDLKTGTLSNGTVGNYIQTIKRIKLHPIADRKLKSVTPAHLQQFFDLLSFGGDDINGIQYPGYSKDYVKSFSAVLGSSFRFAVFPKSYISFNPMQYVVLHYKKETADLFGEKESDDKVKCITHTQFLEMINLLDSSKNPSALPIKIAYYTGLRIGEACALTWNDINFDEQCITIRRSMRRNQVRKGMEIGTTKRNKIRVVEFGDTLSTILKKAKKDQLKNRLRYRELGYRNFYKEGREKNHIYYELHSLQAITEAPENYNELSMVCTKEDGSYTSTEYVSSVCRKLAAKIPGLEGFHFHALRHSYTTNLLANGAAPKDVQELLGHSDVSTTMNVYAHSSREAKKASARLLDKVAGMN